MFDNLNENGLKQGLEQLSNMIRHLQSRERSATVRLAEAEDDLNAYRSMIGFAQQMQVEFTDKLRAIREAREAKEHGE